MKISIYLDLIPTKTPKVSFLSEKECRQYWLAKLSFAFSIRFLWIVLYSLVWHQSKSTKKENGPVMFVMEKLDRVHRYFILHIVVGIEHFKSEDVC